MAGLAVPRLLGRHHALLVALGQHLNRRQQLTRLLVPGSLLPLWRLILGQGLHISGQPLGIRLSPLACCHLLVKAGLPLEGILHDGFNGWIGQSKSGGSQERCDCE